MQPDIDVPAPILSQIEQDELTDLVNILLLSSGMKTIFAIVPEPSPQHPVVEQFKLLLQDSSQEFQFQNFFYSDNSLYNFIYGSEQAAKQASGGNHRRIVMAFGIEQLPLPRILNELKQLNLGREILFQQQIILIFWLNKADFLDEFRSRAPDFWDWRGKVVRFTTRPAINPLLYPYLEWLIAENAYLRTSGVMQVQRQVDIFLDQIYVSLQAVRRQEVTETLDGNASKLARGAYREAEIRQRVSVSSSSYRELDEPDYYEEYAESILEYEPAVTSKKVTQKVDLSQAVRENRYSVILGAPGAGKTTLMHYLALHFATAKREREERVTGREDKEDLGEVRLPVFFRIADYAERLEQQPDLSLCDYLCQFYRQWETYFENGVVESVSQSPTNTGMGEQGNNSNGDNPIAQLLLEQMRLGHCLMLLDGLDEVFDQKIRKQIVQRIDEFVDAFSSNKFVITSRIAGYRDVQLSSRFSEFTIEDMSSEQVENFLYRWCQAIEKAQQPESGEEQWQRAGDAQAREILKAIQENDGVKRLTANPLLLTILALIHRNGERLPNQRVKLYELAVQTLTEDWQLGKKLPDANKVLLSQNEVVEFLAPLADWMHEEKPSGVVTEAEVEQKLAEKLAELNDTEPESELIRQTVQEFLRKVRETTGLFVERAPGVYGFMHLTFEEYFAARYIADNDISEILEIIDLRLHEPRWREPILLALGYYGVHFPNMINKLVKKLFQKLDNYQPALECGEIKIKNAAAPDAMIIWSGLQGEADNTCMQSEFPLQDLLFAGQVITEVEVNNHSIRKKLIDKLVLTYVGVDADFEDDVIKQLLRLLRQIELFNQKGEVIATLKQVGESSVVSQEMCVRVQSAILYITCGEAGTELSQCVTEIVNKLEPDRFCSIGNLVAELGDEMTPALEIMRQNPSGELEQQQALNFITGMSYIRSDNYDKAIAILEEITHQSESPLTPFVYWALAICHEKKEDYSKADEYYSQSKMTDYHETNTLFIFWGHWGWCHRLSGIYEESLKCFQNSLGIAKGLKNYKYEAHILYNIGRTYQDWGKYEDAIAYYQQSRDLYKELNKQSDVANQWYWLGDCYREWSKYQQAIDCELKELEIRQQLDDQTRIALAYYRLGRIYQGWGKYEDAIAHHQQSLELYQQLDKQSNVASRWYNLAECYRDWGKYEQALECQQQCMTIRQTLDDQSLVAVTYYQLGRIYQAWGKYENAIAHYQQSRNLYEELGKQSNVANQWYWLGDCYREWGKYQQAIDCGLKGLEIGQQLDDQPAIVNAYYCLGRIYQGWGKYEDAIAHYQQSLELYEELGKQSNVANQWGWLANTYREWGNYEQAIECRQKYLHTYQNLDNQSNVALGYYHLGRIYQAWGKYEDAIVQYQKSLELYQQLDKQKDVSNLWYWLGDCYKDRSQYEQALECQQFCLTTRQQLDDQPAIASAYYQLGIIYQAWGKYEDAIAHHQQSLELYQQLDKQKSVASRWYNLAECYRDWGKYEQALECQQQCMTICQTLDDQSLVAVTYYQLGRIYQAWGKYEQALECQQQCMTIRQTLDDKSLVAVSYYQLGRIYQAWGKYEDAIAHHQQSLELYQQIGKQENVAHQWDWLAVCYREWGKYEQALDCELKDLAIWQEIQKQPEIASAYYRLGRIYQGWGKYEDAIAHYQQSLELYQQLDKQKNVASRWYNLAECYRDWGKYEQALECQQRCMTIRQPLDDQSLVAVTYYQLGRIYQEWGKYEDAIAHHQQSLELYQQLDLQSNVANRWLWLGDCYREWSKYQQAIDCGLKGLEIRQQLDDQPAIANAYYRLGRIYQAWGKHEDAIAYHQQSLELYQQLGKQQDVANQWYNQADCYREWGKYQQAIDCELKDLAIRQQLDEQKDIADAYYQLGRIYQGWGKYEDAIAHYQQSLELYQQLDLQSNVANRWLWLGDCYREWSKYQQAIDCGLKGLEVHQQLDDQPAIANTYCNLGRIYQAWGKYKDAIAHYQQSLQLYQQLDLQNDVANQLSWLASCYRDLENYPKAIEYSQQSRDLHQKLGKDESVARRCRQLAYSQGLLAKNTQDKAETFNLLAQAEQNIHQAIEISTAGDYTENLAYDHIILSLLNSEYLRLLPADDPSIPEKIAHFEENYHTAFTYFHQLGQTIDQADKALDIARAYLEINALENLERAEELAQTSLQVFQEYNRRKLEASTHKLLGEIYLKRAQINQPSAETSARQFLSASLQIYQELDLQEKAAEVEKLI
ncbi:MAG: tetratricopeptide repeat protein [Calothrix sp. MO_167.B12]|nr:tetratricopeptide repeat protein [Calothrix sp. MO_167.B12]